METTDLSNILSTVMNVMIIPLLPIITGYIVAFVRKKTSEIENQIKNKEIEKYVDIAENAVITAVTAVSQVYTDNLKKANGGLTPEQQKAAFEMAKEKAIKIIGEAGLEALSQLYTDFDAWIEVRIEYYVNQLKKNASPMSLIT